jgi:predicted nucleic acid-binding protein
VISECHHPDVRAWQPGRPRRIDARLLAERALEPALRPQDPVYDCLYVATAIGFEAALASADPGLARLARATVPEVPSIDEAEPS